MSRFKWSVFAAAAFFSGSCGSDGDSLPANADDAVSTLARIAAATYEDSHTRGTELAAAIDAFVAAPSESTLLAARQSWVAARTPYLQAETLRGSDGPIEAVEGLLNAWPLNEAHVDYVLDASDVRIDGGLINDTSFTIDGPALEGQNENPGESDVSVGYHAIEFLLWGQDRSASSPGTRPATDYLTDAGATALHGDRRGLYLSTAADLLVGHLDEVRAAWAEGSTTNYRHDFTTNFGARDSLRRIFTSLYWFSSAELGGDRLAALVTEDQEDEHSCFSDNTRADHLENARGVRNLYMGTYTRIDGTVVSGVGLYDVLHEVDAALAEQLRDRIDASVAAAEAIHDPYDQEIVASNPDGRARVQALATSLGLQTSLLLAAAEELGLTPLGSTP